MTASNTTGAKVVDDPPAEQARRGRPSDPDLDDALLRAAVDLVVERGYGRLTTAAVARRAGASTASLYRRWPAKQHLVAAVARRITFDALGDIDTGSLEGDLRELLLRKQRLFGHIGPVLLALMAEAQHDEELRAILHEEAFGAARRRALDVVQAAVTRGELDEVPPPPALDVLGLVLLGAGLTRSVFFPAPSPAATGRGADPMIETELNLLLGSLRRTDTPENGPDRARRPEPRGQRSPAVHPRAAG